MATPSIGSIQRTPGQLVWNPTNLAAAEPYGGTYLGVTRDKEFTPAPIVRPIWNEAAATYTDAIYGGERVVFKAILRYPDADAITTTAFKAITVGGVGTHWLFRPMGTTANTRAGTSLSAGRSGVLLFAPRAPLYHDAILLYNAVPAIDEAAKLQMSLGEEYGLAVAFYGTPDSSGRVYDTGLLATLSL